MEKQKRNDHNIGLKILSGVLALLIWLMIYNMSDSLTISKQSVELEHTNGSQLTDAGMFYEISGTDHITVEYKVRTRDQYKITSRDFRCFVNLADVSITGSVPVYVEVLNGKDSYITDIKIDPQIVRVDTDKLQTKYFKISYDLIGDVKDGYSINTCKLEENGVQIVGPTSQLGRISRAVAKIPVDKLSENTSGKTKIVYLDSNNNEIKFDSKYNMDYSIKDTKYSVILDKTKEVEVSLNVAGKPEDGMIYTSYSLTPSKISITGDIETVDNISAIDLGTINLSGRTESFIEDINASNRVPEGITVNGNSIIKAAVNLAKIEIETQPETTSEATEEHKIGPGETKESGEEKEESKEEGAE